MPSFDNMLVWYGVIFVHHGYYRKGVFKFRIELPRHYPNVRPEVYFIGPVHHPYVRANGHLDLSLPFKQWIPKQHFIIHVLQFMKKMFYKIDVLVIDDPKHAPNPEALELYRDSTIRFWHAAQKCVNDCATKQYQHPLDCSIRFMKFDANEEAYKGVLQKMLEGFGKDQQQSGETAGAPAEDPSTPQKQALGNEQHHAGYLTWFVGGVKQKINNVMSKLSKNKDGTTTA